MTSKEQSIAFLKQYLQAKKLFPRVADYAKQAAIDRLQGLGGMGGSWRTDYSECTYYTPQRVDGQLVDLSTVKKIRAFYEQNKPISQ